MISLYLHRYENARISSGFTAYRPTSLKDFCQKITQFPWSPIVWRDGYRKIDNFISAQLLALDFDNDPGDDITSLAQAMENIFPDYKHVIGTTKSHGIDKPGKGVADRFRVVLWFDRPITDRDEYRYNLTYAAKKWGTDMQAADAGRFFFPCKKIVAAADGERWDVLQEPQADVERRERIADMRRRESQAYVAIGKMHPAVEAFLKTRAAPGQRNKSIFSAACRLAENPALGFDGIMGILEGSETYKAYANNAAFCREVVSTVKSAIKRVHEHG